MWNDVKHQEIPEDTTVLSLLLRSRFYIQGIVGIRSLYDTMQVPFHCRTFPDCEPRNHVPRNYIPGIRWNSSKCKGCDGNLYWFTMSIITCYFSEVAKIIVVTSLPWNALRSDPNNPHMGTQPSLETLITPCHSCRCPPGQRQPPYQGFWPDKNIQSNRKMMVLLDRWGFEDERSFSIDLDVIYASTSMFHFTCDSYDIIG